MPVSLSRRYRKKKFMRYKLFLFFLVLSCQSAFSQVVYERHTNEVYNFLSRFAQKGVIVFDDLIRPISKEKIKTALDSVAAHPAVVIIALEKKELDFYLEEYTEGSRKRIFKSGQLKIFQDRGRSDCLSQRISRARAKTSRPRVQGINLWGRAGKRLGLSSFLSRR
jgi:hypothetical protein